MVANGKAAMELQGDWELSAMMPLADDKKWLRLQARLVPLPGRRRRGPVPRCRPRRWRRLLVHDEGDRACTDFLKYIPGEEVQKKLVRPARRRCRPTPPRVSAISDPPLKDVLA